MAADRPDCILSQRPQKASAARKGYLLTVAGLRLLSVTLTIDIESNGEGEREER
jgi:hypothetical protein